MFITMSLDQHAGMLVRIEQGDGPPPAGCETRGAESGPLDADDRAWTCRGDPTAAGHGLSGLSSGVGPSPCLPAPRRPAPPTSAHARNMHKTAKSFLTHFTGFHIVNLSDIGWPRHLLASEFLPSHP